MYQPPAENDHSWFLNGPEHRSVSEFSDMMDNEPERVDDGGAEDTVSQISTTTSIVSTLQPTKMLDIHCDVIQVVVQSSGTSMVVQKRQCKMVSTMIGTSRVSVVIGRNSRNGPMQTS